MGILEFLGYYYLAMIGLFIFALIPSPNYRGYSHDANFMGVIVLSVLPVIFTFIYFILTSISSKLFG